MLNINKNIFYWNILTKKEKIHVLSRPHINSNKNIKELVFKIIDNVKKHGDLALHSYNLEFDNFKCKSFYISRKKIDNSSNLVSKKFKDAISIALSNINNFHSKQILSDLIVETYPGVYCKHIYRPIQSVGLYVPKGNHPLVSTALMLSIPAKLAGCHNITLCSPPPISNEILYIAKILKIYTVLQLGGAHSIAALALGTETVKFVDKIFGPGNIFVTEAKLQVSQCSLTSIDMPAGPSEMLVIADDLSNPAFIASDLLSQAEHSQNSQVILLCTKNFIVKNVIKEIQKQLLLIPNKNIILHSLKNSRFIVVNSLKECFKISNLYSPEHLILHIKNSKNFLKYINNAGSVFLGKWTPGAAGDYITGANHVLPTYGYANSYSSLRVSDFQKIITVQKMTKIALQSLSKSIATLSLMEGMNAHNQSIVTRIKFL
ncbi:histidinol dehydrogenase [Buchnera aphidicola]|uniref:Histidinol dehydrogenase n=1 Tax=Buchnera aphidicola subsp. Cinara cedri (strain Cc) TaxID=372461 RepID=Q058A7_BUCCC|nr:histidinol dehydrogenase [Buchnera aphidicola]ABJ90542.1 histidinol dehydrogenase [Buchnera aphidicola BCc]